MSDKIAVVVPSNRPEEMVKFKEAWQDKLNEAEAKLYLIEDQPDTWDTIKSDLGRDSWIIPCKTDCIRSYGYLQALRDGNDYIVTLDDDVRPHENNNPILEHVRMLKRVVEPDNWIRTLRQPSAPITRGLPMIRRVVLNHGLWSGVPDVPATIQLEGYTYTGPDPNDSLVIPRGKFYPMSGMNLSWLTPLTNYMYFGLQGCDIRDPETRWGLDRYGDIMAGVMSKIMIDRMPNAAIHSGQPWVQHLRASDPIKNLELEKTGLTIPNVYSMYLQGSDSWLIMAERLMNFSLPNRVYCKNLGRAMRVWNELIKKG